MTTTTRRCLQIAVFALLNITICHATSIGQEVEGEGRRGARTPRPAPALTFDTRDNQLTSQVQPEGPNGEPRDTIAFTVWDLTIADSSAPETDELVGKLIDKANNLPTVVGTADDVRELIGRLKAASLLRKSREFRLITTDSQPASVQSGTDRPSVIATQVSPVGAGRSARPRATLELQQTNPGPAPAETPAPEQVVTNSIQMRSVGTLVQLTPRIDAAGGIVVQFNYSSSDLERSANVMLSEIPGRKPMMADYTTTCQVQSVLRLKSGTAVVVQSDTMQSADGETPTGRTQLLILAASVQPVLE